MRFVVSPARADLDPQLQEHRRAQQLFQLLSGLGTDALQALAAAADDHALVGLALDHDAGGDAPQVALFLELVDHHRRGVGQLVAGQAEQFFANDLAGQKAVAAVGQRIFFVEPILLRKIRFDDAEQALHVGVFPGAERHELGEGVAVLHAFEPRRQIGAAMHLVELVGDQEHRLRVFPRRHQRQHLGIVQSEAAGLDHEQHHVHIGQHAVHGAVQRAVQRGGVLGLKTGGVDEDELRTPDRADAGDAVPRGLRLGRGDADLLPDQRVQQRGFAHVRTTDDGDQSAAPGGQVAGRGGFGLASSIGRVGNVHRGAIKSAAGCLVCRWSAMRRACAARLPARRRGASAPHPGASG